MIKKSLKNKKGIIFLTGLILLMALFLRIYKINTNLIFVYDQGRDALIIRDILKGKLTLIGPTTGIPGFFLGPFYYYLITPFYWLGKGNPTYPLFFLNLLCLGGIILAGLMAKKKNNWLAFFLCLILLATNFSHIRQSRWLSNPNPIFFLAPLYFFLLTFLLKKGRFDSWFIASNRVG
jgi:4-amino-4-deoxy-L-arabinose transferase-like glycosyltransferase